MAGDIHLTRGPWTGGRLDCERCSNNTFGTFSILPVLLAVYKSSSLERRTSMTSSSVILSAFCFLLKRITLCARRFVVDGGRRTVDGGRATILVVEHACFFLSNGICSEFGVGGSERRPHCFQLIAGSSVMSFWGAVLLCLSVTVTAFKSWIAPGASL